MRRITTKNYKTEHDKFYLDIKNPKTGEIERKKLILVRDTAEKRIPLPNEIVLNIPSNEYYFEIDDK
jgi:hypothetical protein